MKPIIILNGPPGCGKDTIAKYLTKHAYCLLSFKSPMFNIAREMLGQDKYQEFLRRYDDRALKEVVWDYIGMSPRRFMIYISESCVKPVIGENAFGILAADAVKRHAHIDVFEGFVFSDGGFPAETKDFYRAGAFDLYIVRLHREGYNFDNDSRDYLEGDHLDIYLEEGNPLAAVYEILEAINERV